MLRLLNIWLLAFCIVGFAQNYVPVTELSFPSQVAINSTFDISLVIDNSITDADKLNLYLISRNNLELNQTQIKTEEFVLQQNFTPSALPGISDKVFLLEINLRSDIYFIQSFFQVLVNINASNSEFLSIRFYGEFFKDKKFIAKIGSNENIIEESDKNLLANISTYKPGKTTKNAAKLESNSKLSIDLNNFAANKLWIGFWIKPSSGDTEILRLSNKQNNLPILILGLSKFQKGYLLDFNKNTINQSAPFFSRRTWSHLAIYYIASNKTLTFFKDGNIFCKTQLTGVEQISDLELIFGNEIKSSFTIEQLRLIKIKDDQSLAIKDANYISISPATGRVLLQMNFDSTTELALNNFNNSIFQQGIRLVSSDAPIFSRSPILDVQVSSSYNLLEWTTSDIKSVSHFIIEKSSSDNKFVEISSIAVIDDGNASYNYLDASVKTGEIIFYRIKQVNKDGSFVYSAQVKVGLGAYEQFRLGQNYPNPFNPVTSIEFDLFEDSEIEVIVYNLEGQEMVVLQRGHLNKGVHKFEFDASNLPSGIYLYKVSSPFYSQTKKMLLTK